MRIFFICLLSILLFFSVNPQVFASYPGGYTPSLSPDELVRQADLIAFGTIVGYEGYIGKYDSVYTDTLVDVEYYLKKPIKALTLRIQEDGGFARVSPTTFVSSTGGIGAIGEIGDQAFFFLEKRGEKYRFLRPNGILYYSDRKELSKVEIYKKLLTLPKTYAHTVPLEGQLLIGLMSLVAIIAFISAIRLKKSVHIA